MEVFMKSSPLKETRGEPLTRVKAGHDLAAVFKNLVSNLVDTGNLWSKWFVPSPFPFLLASLYWYWFRIPCNVCLAILCSWGHAILDS